MKKTKTNPKALGATEKIRPMGPVLGGKEKRPSPNKFVGCSAEVDLEDKDILDELAEPVGLSKSLMPLKTLNKDKGAGLVLRSGYVLTGEWHYLLRAQASSLDLATYQSIRIRMAGSCEGYKYATAIEFPLVKDIPIVKRIVRLLKPDLDEYAIKLTSSPYKKFEGSKQEVLKQLTEFDQELGVKQAPVQSAVMSYWRSNELQEGAGAAPRFGKISELNSRMGAGLILANDQVIVGSSHYSLQSFADSQVEGRDCKDAYLANGAVRIRLQGSCDGFARYTEIEFGNTDGSTFARVRRALEEVQGPQNNYNIECTQGHYFQFTGHKDDCFDALEFWESKQTKAFSTMSFWHESKNVKASLQEKFNSYRVRKAGFIPCYISEDAVLHMLFVKSSNAIYSGAAWQIAKGHVDGKEGFLSAAIREAKEETGLRMENLDAGTVQQVWAGQLTGDIETYDFAVYAGLVHDPKNFEATDYEIAGTRWMTAEEFNQEGKPNQQNIVSVCAKKFNEN